MRITRYWMTGCMALILLGAGRWPLRDEQEEEREGQQARITMTSKYDVDETVRQISRSVRRNGLPVVLNASVKAPDGADQDQEARVLVLGDEGGQTPVLQAEGQATPELPWKVVVRPLPDGQAEVLLNDPRDLAPPEGVSPQTASKVASLIKLVKNAIT